MKRRPSWARLWAEMWVELPSEVHWNDASNLLGDADEHGVRQVEVWSRGITPATQRTRRTEVGGSHCDWVSTVTVIRASRVAADLIASSAAQTVVEESGAQSGSLNTVSTSVKVSESTCTTCEPKRIANFEHTDPIQWKNTATESHQITKIKQY